VVRGGGDGRIYPARIQSGQFFRRAAKAEEIARADSRHLIERAHRDDAGDELLEHGCVPLIGELGEGRFRKGTDSLPDAAHDRMNVEGPFFSNVAHGGQYQPLDPSPHRMENNGAGRIEQ